jgi:hypothetical protein
MVAEPVARGRAAGGALVRRGRGDGLDLGPRRPAPARAGRRRDGRSRRARRALARRAACAARLGMRLSLRGDGRDPVLRRSAHPARDRGEAAGRGRHPRAERGLPPADGLLCARADHAGDPRPHRRHRARDPGLHARQRLARQRRRHDPARRPERWPHKGKTLPTSAGRMEEMLRGGARGRRIAPFAKPVVEAASGPA